MRVIKVNWYGFVHEKVSQRYGVGAFVNSFCVNGEELPVQVYHNPNPDRSRNQRDYLLVQELPSDASGARFVALRGVDLPQMKFHRYQDAVLCLRCNEVVHSVTVTDVRSCTCESVTVEGGAESLTYEGSPEYARVVTLDFLTDSIIPETNQTSH